MNTFSICIFGIIFLFVFSFILSFYHPILNAFQYRAAKKKKVRSRSSTENESARKARLKIPGYYEELSKRSKNDDYYFNSRPTVI